MEDYEDTDPDTLHAGLNDNNYPPPKKWTLPELLDMIGETHLSSRIQLRPHQLEGLLFLLNREEENSGCILAHDMGLGKTIQTLLLIAISNIIRPAGTTLILCPRASSDNWVSEIKKSFSPIPNVLQFKGKEKGVEKWISYKQTGNVIEETFLSAKSITRDSIGGFSILITHYHAFISIWQTKVIQPLRDILNMQHRRRDDWELDVEDRVNMLRDAFREFEWPDNKRRIDSRILDIEIIPDMARKRLGEALAFPYKRIVVDESHNMKNAKTHLATMAYAISAQYRVSLTGTPRINDDDDVWSQFHFLRIPNLVNLKEFKTKSLTIKKLEKKHQWDVIVFGKQKADEYQRTRRAVDVSESKDYVENLYTKYMHRITKQEIATRESTNTPHDNIKRPSAFGDEKTLIDSSNSTLNSNLYCKDWYVPFPKLFVDVYEKIRKSRLGEVSGDLMGNDDKVPEDVESSIDANDPKNSRVYMFATMQILRQLCCDHRICEDYIRQYCSPDDARKIMCLTPPKYVDCLRYIKTRVRPEEKIVIFCYYKKACSNLSKYLEAHRVGKTVIVTGEVSMSKKTAIIKEFQEKPDPRILIATICLKEGITLTRANHCIFMTNWWNNAEEMQSVGRLHRLGQTRDVHVAYHMLRGTIDDHIKFVSQSKGTVPSSMQLFEILGMQLDEIKQSDLPYTTLPDIDLPDIEKVPENIFIPLEPVIRDSKTPRILTDDNLDSETEDENLDSEIESHTKDEEAKGDEDEEGENEEEAKEEEEEENEEEEKEEEEKDKDPDFIPHKKPNKITVYVTSTPSPPDKKRKRRECLSSGKRSRSTTPKIDSHEDDDAETDSLENQFTLPNIHDKGDDYHLSQDYPLTQTRFRKIESKPTERVDGGSDEKSESEISPVEISSSISQNICMVEKYEKKMNTVLSESIRMIKKNQDSYKHILDFKAIVRDLFYRHRFHKIMKTPGQTL